MSDEPERPIRKPLLVLAILLMLLIVAGSWFISENKIAAARRTAGDALTSIAKLKADAISAWMKERRGDAEVVSAGLATQELAANPNDAALKAKVKQLAGDFRRAYDYDAIALFDRHGSNTLTVPADGLTKFSDLKDEIQLAIHAREVVFLDLHRDKPGEPIHLSFLCPLRINPKSSRPANGVVLLLIDPARYLFPLVETWPTPSRTGETMLLRREDDEVVYLNELRRHKGSALTLRLPLQSKTNLPSAIAVQGIEGVFEGRDYDGVPVLAATRQIPGTPWFIAAKMDREEIFAPVRKEIMMIGVIVFLLISVTLLGIGPLWREQRLRLIRQQLAERKQAEEERTRLAAAIEQAAETIMITGADGNIFYVNPAFEQATGYTRQEALGKNPRILKSGRHDDAFYERMWDTLRRGEIWHGRIINKRKDGTLYEEEATISPVRDASGKIVNYIALKLDVTREAKLKEQLRQSQKMEAIGQLAGGVAHDFNNLLGVMILQAELTANTENLPQRVRDALKEIQIAAERGAKLTRQLLLFSRKQVMQARRLDLNEVVTNLAKMLQRIIGEDVWMQLQLYPRELTIHADAGMLDQVLMNLVVNARDAMPGGGSLFVETSESDVDEAFVKLNPDARPGRYACLSVRDTGTGIPVESLPHIFEPFFTTKQPGKGTGLGLATVFGIVKQHQGFLKAESEMDRGTTFRIYLPVSEAAPPSSALAAKPKSRGGTETILLVEDDDSIRLAARLAMEGQGYHVLESPNGEEAIEVWKQHSTSVALLVTDLVMPGGVSGHELARRLQEDRPQLKVIFMSGYSAEIAGRQLELKSGEYFLQKPFPPDQFTDTIRRCLDS